MIGTFEYIQHDPRLYPRPQSNLTMREWDAGSTRARKALPDPLSPTFQLKRNYYDGRTIIFNKSAVTFEPGRTVLVGANGTGKSTMLDAIERQLRKERAACLAYDDRRSGGIRLAGAFTIAGDIEGIASVVCGSEGERIHIGIARFAGEIRTLFESNRNRPCWILIDSTDSGFSIDNIIEMKEFLDIIETDAKNVYNITLYVVVTANSYEMAAGERCLEPKTGQYHSFKSYQGYRRFILSSRRRKDRRDGIRRSENGNRCVV